MRYQAKPGWCGPAAIVNALRCFGLRVRQDLAAKYADTERLLALNEDTQHGLKDAIERFGFTHSEIKERKYENAEYTLVGHLRNGPSIILTEEGNHWEAAIGMVGDHVIVADSQNLKFNQAENGVHILALGKQLRRYWSPHEGHRYAINIYPKKR